MTHLMEQALVEIGKLPEADQDAIAAIILDEIVDERRWDESFSGRRTSWQRSPIAFAMTFEWAGSRMWGLTSFDFSGYRQFPRMFHSTIEPPNKTEDLEGIRHPLDDSPDVC